MTYAAQVYRVLIASPGDVEKERNQISSTINDWNCVHSESHEKVLLPVRWETHAKPGAGRAQELINEQIVKKCDILIGVFWTRLGSPTGDYASGTVEEIEEFLAAKKPVMLYFSKKDFPSDVNLDQLKLLREFKEKMQPKCLFFEYGDLIELKEHISRHISLEMEGGRKSQSNVAVEAPENKVKKIIVSEEIYFEDYEKDGVVKSFLVKGSTQRIKDELKQLGGRWNNSLGGWVFSKKKEDETRKALREFL
jgi:nucleoside 2-deoxyribosyltransferase